MGYGKNAGGMAAGERWRAVVAGKPVDRLPVVEWAPWWGLTLDRWYGEGLKAGWQGGGGAGLEIQRHFGLDGCVQSYFNPETAATLAAPSHGAGVLKTEAEYENIRKTLFRDPATCLSKERFEWLKKTRAEGDVIHWFTVEGFFWHPRDLLGIEAHLFSFYDEPALLRRICGDHLQWLKRVIEFVGNTFQFDFMSFAEDMSYNNGPMLSKELFDEFLAPYYGQIIPLIQKAGIPVFIDSDGNVEKAVDWYAGAGADGIFPLERQAGVDVGLYIDKHPEITYLGHFDKMRMKYGEAAMRAEFERLLPAARRGKLIFSVDHQTPPDVSMGNYGIYVKLLKEYAVLARQ
ncbi:MAG: hypothetical protein LBL66_08230 [Clostridiales bacterium]|nr:hypothetical protein [Clostridiales bacterium]